MVHNFQLLKRFLIICFILLVIENKYRTFCLHKKIFVIIGRIKYKTWNCNSSIMTSLPFVGRDFPAVYKTKYFTISMFC